MNCSDLNCIYPLPPVPDFHEWNANVLHHSDLQEAFRGNTQAIARDIVHM